MHKQVLAFITGNNIDKFVDLEIFWATAE